MTVRRTTTRAALVGGILALALEWQARLVRDHVLGQEVALLVDRAAP